MDNLPLYDVQCVRAFSMVNISTYPLFTSLFGYHGITNLKTQFTIRTGNTIHSGFNPLGHNIFICHIRGLGIQFGNGTGAGVYAFS